jgi:hypothetical protein
MRRCEAACRGTGCPHCCIRLAHLFSHIHSLPAPSASPSSTSHLPSLSTYSTRLRSLFHLSVPLSLDTLSHTSSTSHPNSPRLRTTRRAVSQHGGIQRACKRWRGRGEESQMMQVSPTACDGLDMSGGGDERRAGQACSGGGRGRTDSAWLCCTEIRQVHPAGTPSSSSWLVHLCWRRHDLLQKEARRLSIAPCFGVALLL